MLGLELLAMAALLLLLIRLRTPSPTREAAATLELLLEEWKPMARTHRNNLIMTPQYPVWHPQHDEEQDLTKATRNKLEADLLKVRRFAKELRALPVREGGVIERRGSTRAPQEETTTCFVNHPTGSPLEHHGILPKLTKAPAEHTPYTIPGIAPMYRDQRNGREQGRAFADWQKALAGTVTLPHVDRDAQEDLIGTHIIVTKGSQLIVAWRDEELHWKQALRAIDRPYPSMQLLHKIPSLTVMRISKGEHVYMPPGTAHMVVTLTDKTHLAFHEY